jgi:hypothetical protein
VAELWDARIHAYAPQCRLRINSSKSLVVEGKQKDYMYSHKLEVKM